jgi:hypothetical protein
MIEYLDLNGYRLHDAGTRVLSAARGLTGVPGVRGDASDRPEEDGAVESARLYMPARVVTLEGEVWGDSEAACWSEWDDVSPVLESTLRRTGTITWRKVGSGVDLTLAVRLISAVTPDIVSDDEGPRLVYQAQLRAADPRHYAVADRIAQVAAPTAVGGMAFPLAFPILFTATGVAGGQLTVSNLGNTKTWPVFSLFGPIAQPVIENLTRGERLVFERLNLAAGEQLVVDTSPTRRSATVGGVSVLGDLRMSESTFFPISARASETLRFFGLGGGYAGSTLLSVTLRDAYIS